MEREVNIWISSVKLDDSGMNKELEKQKTEYFQKRSINLVLDENIVTINDNMKYQKIDGFGISITEASSFLCEKVLQKEEKKKLLESIFDSKKGIGVSMIRQPIGASDHCTKPYDFVKNEQPDELPQFDFSTEEKEVLPTVFAALEEADRDVKIMVAAWSAPKWMKHNQSELGIDIERCEPGFLKEEKYAAYACYLRKFIQEYEKRGLNVFAVSPVNEPDFANYAWPTMPMTSEQEKNFIVKYLDSELKQHELNTKIMCWDHNFDSFNYTDGSYVDDIYEDEAAYQVIAGSAWHWYEGSPDTLFRIKKKYPDKEIWITEASGGEWGYKQWKDAFLYQAKSNIEILRNYAQSIIYWNMVLDSNGAPDYYYMKMQHTHSQNRGLATIDAITKNITYNTDYYSLGQFCKFIEPGAYRIASNSNLREGVYNVAFMNPDNMKVLIVFNENEKHNSICIRDGEEVVSYIIPPLSLTTFCWKNEEIKETRFSETILYNDCSQEDTYTGEKNLQLMKVENMQGLAKGVKVTIDGSFLDQDNGLVTFYPMNHREQVDVSNYDYFAFSANNLRYYQGISATVIFEDIHGRSYSTETKEKAPYAKWGEIYLSLNDIEGIDLSCLANVKIGFEGKDRDIFLIADLKFVFGTYKLLCK